MRSQGYQAMLVVTRASATAGQSKLESAKNQNASMSQYLLLSVIVLIAAGLRFYKLGEWSFWGDEFTTIRRAIAMFDGGFTFGSISRMVTYFSMNAWGINEWSARLPAAVFGLLTVPVVYFLVKKMFDPAVALLSSALLAVSPWHIYWSQNARFYTPLLLFFTLGLFFFYFFVEEDRLVYLLLSSAFFGLALNERLLAVFLVPITFGFVILVRLLRFELPASLRRPHIYYYFGLCAAVGLVLLGIQPNLRNFDLLVNVFGLVNNNPFWIVAGVTYYLGVPLVCAAAVGGAYLLWQKRRATLLLLLAALIPLISIMVLSLFQYSANRYVFVSLTSVIVLASVAITELLRQAPRGLKLLIAGSVLVLLLAPMVDNFLYYQFQNGNRENWKGAFAFIVTLKSNEDQVVTVERGIADYYLGERTGAMQAIHDIEAYVRNKRRTWFVIDGTTADKAPQTYRWILANAQLVANFDVTVSVRTYPMRVYLYDPERPPVLKAAKASWLASYYSGAGA
jgi:mannosyltransferase